MDTFMDKLAEKISAQSAASGNGYQPAGRGGERQSPQQNVIKKQQVQQPAITGALLEEVKKGNEKQKAELVAAFQEDSLRQAELVRQTAEELMRRDAESVKQIEEYVHKESVKCYRNMQAVMLEQTAAIAGEQAKSKKTALVWAVTATVLLAAETILLAVHLLGLL